MQKLDIIADADQIVGDMETLTGEERIEALAVIRKNYNIAESLRRDISFALKRPYRNYPEGAKEKDQARLQSYRKATSVYRKALRNG